MKINQRHKAQKIALLVAGLLAGLIVGLVAVQSSVHFGTEYFRHVPTDELHTMRVYEDGSFVIEYVDDTSEIGCLPTGLCQD